MGDLFQVDRWRMDWGLGNPNKTAALIVGLLVAVWLLARRGPRGFWVAFALWLPLLFCLARTGSRGGIVAAACGHAALVLFAGHRGWGPARVGAIVVALVGVVAWDGLGRGGGVGERFREARDGDRSVGNRLVLWSKVPAMVRDAPAGWGSGRSGWAYTQWYQPAATRLEYRTLVNSHLTFLVERGWVGRILYFMGWTAAFWLCWPGWPARSGSVPLGCWIALGVAASFSSVLEAWQVWLVPVAMLGVTAWDRVRAGRRPGVRGAIGVSLVGLLCAAILFAFGAVPGAREEIRGCGESVSIGARAAPCRVVLAGPDPSVLGTHYGIEIRERCARGDIRWRVIGAGDGRACRGEAIDADLLVFSGRIDEGATRVAARVRPRAIVLLNPVDGGWIGRRDFCGLGIPVSVMIGLRRMDATAVDIVRFGREEGWEIIPVKGAARYLGGWIEMVTATVERLPCR